MDSNSLLHRYLLGDLSQEEVEQLNQRLADDPELRREFVQAATMDAGLREVAFERGAEPVRDDSAKTPSKRRLWTAVVSAAAVAVALVAVGITFFSENAVAILASSENAAWESSLPTTPGSELSAGLLNLKSGVATIRFESGAEVLLEAPAALELISSMRGRLVSGAAVIDVPDSAIGFIIETPDGYAVDYGTRFAVRVDQAEMRSNFEIIEGEIAVHHAETGEEVRLTGQSKSATVSAESIVVVDIEHEAESSEPTSNIIRVGTGGRTGSAMRRDNKRHKYIKREFLSVKRTDSGNWDHRSFFSFDLKSVDLEPVSSARLRLNLVPSTRGLVSRLPKINRFGIYGLTNQAKADWQFGCLWDESPGPEDGVLLGTFEIPRSQQRGSFSIQNEALLEFLQRHQDAAVTLILVRETTQIEGVGPGLTHLFASDSHPEAVGPMLEFTLNE